MYVCTNVIVMPLCTFFVAQTLFGIWGVGSTDWVRQTGLLELRVLICRSTPIAPILAC
jgi:hypothetical protein